MADEQVDPTTPIDTAGEPPATISAEPIDASAAAEAPADEVVEAELVETPEAEPDAATGAGASYAEPGMTQPQPQYVVVEAPRVPRKHSNRGIGSLLAVAGAVIFGGLAVGATYLLGLASGVDSFAFLGNLKFYLPIIVFAIAFVLLVLIVNRGAWWAYILGSLVVGVVVYFGTAAAGYGADQLAVQLGQTTADKVPSFTDDLVRSPFVVIAAILAREVAIWWGSLIAHRGRRMKAKNAVAREAFDRQLAEFHAKYGQTTPV